MLYHFQDLRMRDVVNIANGKYLGKVADVLIDKEEGTIYALLVIGEGLFPQKNAIRYEGVKLIGLDVILVDLGLVEKEKMGV